MSITVGPYKQGEIPDPLVYTFDDAAGTPIPNDGFTGKAELYPPGATEPIEAELDLDDSILEATYIIPELEAWGTHRLDFFVGNNGQLRYAQSFRFYVYPSTVVPEV